MNKRFALLTTTATVSALLAVPTAAGAAPVRADVEREKEGRCSASSHWDFSLEKEHGWIDVDVDIIAGTFSRPSAFPCSSIGRAPDC